MTIMCTVVEQFPDHPNPSSQTVLDMSFCNGTIIYMFLNVLFKCVQVPVPVVW